MIPQHTNIIYINHKGHIPNFLLSIATNFRDSPRRMKTPLIPPSEGD